MAGGRHLSASRPISGSRSGGSRSGGLNRLTAKAPTAATLAHPLDGSLSIGCHVLDLVRTFEMLMKTVLEPLGGEAAAAAGELLGDRGKRDAGVEGGKLRGVLDLMTFAHPHNDPVASPRHVSRIHTEAPRSVASSRAASPTRCPYTLYPKL